MSIPGAGADAGACAYVAAWWCCAMTSCIGINLRAELCWSVRIALVQPARFSPVWCFDAGVLDAGAYYVLIMATWYVLCDDIMHGINCARWSSGSRSSLNVRFSPPTSGVSDAGACGRLVCVRAMTSCIGIMRGVVGRQDRACAAQRAFLVLLLMLLMVIMFI
jgi:hypothetical protein